MSNAKSLTEMALNTAMMVSFAMGPQGAVPGAILAVGSFIVALLWPDNNQGVPPEDLPASKKEIDDDFKKFKAEVEEILAKAAIKGDVGAVTGKTETLHFNWGQILKVKIDKSGYHFLQDPSDANFITDIDTYFDIGANGGLLDETNQYLSDIQLSGLPDSKTFGLYALIGSLRVAYLKYAVVWAWGKQVRYSLPYTDFLIAHKAYNKACDDDPTYADTHPKPAPPDPSVSSELPEWQDWIQTPGSPVKKLISEVNSLVSASEGPSGMQTKLAANWADRVRQVQNRNGDFMVSKDPGSFTQYRVADTKQGTFTPYTNFTLACIWMDMMAGGQIAYLWQTLTDQYALDGVKEDDITTFGKTIAQWKVTRDSVKINH